jgi:hypothetical protein
MKIYSCINWLIRQEVAAFICISRLDCKQLATFDLIASFQLGDKE